MHSRRTLGVLWNVLWFSLLFRFIQGSRDSACDRRRDIRGRPRRSLPRRESDAEMSAINFRSRMRRDISTLFRLLT